MLLSDSPRRRPDLIRSWFEHESTIIIHNHVAIINPHHIITLYANYDKIHMN